MPKVGDCKNAVLMRWLDSKRHLLWDIHRKHAPRNGDAKDRSDRVRVRDALKEAGSGTANSIRATLGMERYRCEKFLKELVAGNEADCMPIEVSGNKTLKYQAI